MSARAPSEEAIKLSDKWPSEKATTAALNAYFADEPDPPGSAGFACMASAVAAAYAVDFPSPPVVSGERQWRALRDEQTSTWIAGEVDGTEVQRTVTITGTLAEAEAVVGALNALARGAGSGELERLAQMLLAHTKESWLNHFPDDAAERMAGYLLAQGVGLRPEHQSGRDAVLEECNGSCAAGDLGPDHCPVHGTFRALTTAREGQETDARRTSVQVDRPEDLPDAVKKVTEGSHAAFRAASPSLGRLREVASRLFKALGGGMDEIVEAADALRAELKQGEET